MQQNLLVHLPNLNYETRGLHRNSRSEVFCEKRCSWKFRNIHRKTPALDFYFNKVAGLQTSQVFSCEYCEISKNTYFEEHLKTAVPGFTF